MATMVLTVYGNDRAGLVDSVAEAVDDNGGSWDKSYMAELAGKFAGVVAITVPDAKVAALLAAFEPLRAAGLDIAAHAVDTVPDAGSYRELHLVVTGQDHPGIIHDVSHALAARGISIAELATETRDAPMGGGVLFEAQLTLHAPQTASVGELHDALAKVADELVVDFELSEA
ncbi:MAG: amino acid-binding ACT protein [Acidimicrobiia bacterium]|nr:amino acid-binding ACT protein [Acidimicrobiia bacterium]